MEELRQLKPASLRLRQAQELLDKAIRKHQSLAGEEADLQLLLSAKVLEVKTSTVTIARLAEEVGELQQRAREEHKHALRASAALIATGAVLPGTPELPASVSPTVLAARLAAAFPPKALASFWSWAASVD